MPKIIQLKADKLLLRQWIPADLPEFARMNADPKVMEFFPEILEKSQSDQLGEKIRLDIESQGWGLWAIELLENHSFIGFAGLNKVDFGLDFTPCIEIGWRLDRTWWGKGYATQAANRVLQFAFTQAKFAEIYSFTSIKNIRSRKLMQRINMVNTNQYFDHPGLNSNHPLAKHVLYKLTRSQWTGFQNSSSIF